MINHKSIVPEAWNLSARLAQVLVMAFALACSESIAFSMDSSEMTATYGRGVHAYFSGQLSQAEGLFSQVIETGTKDPRVFYFRAMVHMQLGRNAEADSDMRTGAAIEAENPGTRLTVSRSLQRVQGYHRKALENFRREARLERLQMMRTQSQVRYENLQRRNESVLHKDSPVRLETLADPQMKKALPSNANELNKPQMPASPPVESQDPDDLFGGSDPEDDGLFEDSTSTDTDEGNPFPSDEPEEPSTDKDSTEEADEFDLFGEESGQEENSFVSEPTKNSSASASTNTVPSTPAEQALGSTFFAIGQWISGESKDATLSIAGGTSFEDSEGFSQTGFEDFGEDDSAFPAEESEDTVDDPFDFE